MTFIIDFGFLFKTLRKYSVGTLSVGPTASHFLVASGSLRANVSHQFPLGGTSQVLAPRSTAQKG